MTDERIKWDGDREYARWDQAKDMVRMFLESKIEHSLKQAHNNRANEIYDACMCNAWILNELLDRLKEMGS